MASSWCSSVGASRPARPKGPPVINFRSEGRRFPKGRCLIPASHFFEFTGTKVAEVEMEVHQGRRTIGSASLACWRPMPDGEGEAFTLLTTEPGPDVAPIHDRQMVVLDRADWTRLARPEPAGKQSCSTRCPPGRLSSSRLR